MSLAHILLGILGLGLLMVVHEGGHFLAARAFRMRVTRFSIGFGPALWRHTPEGSPTTYQIAIIPFLAYVQIAGMNPLEEIDPEDKGSYANASLIGRIVTIFAGPFANYLFASVLFLVSLLIGGKEIPSTRITVVQPDTPAAAAHMQDGDKVVAVAGRPIETWDELRESISAHPNETIDVVVERDNQRLDLKVTPKATGENGSGRIGVAPRPESVPVGLNEAVQLAIERPAQVVVATGVGIGRLVSGKAKLDELSGPVGIVRETARAVKGGFSYYMQFLGMLSAYLGAFNLLPIPALDGGRLMFLGYEATTRRRPNPKVEAQVHAIGLVMMLALIVVVTFVSDIPRRY